jgi:hypothetical protein
MADHGEVNTDHCGLIIQPVALSAIAAEIGRLCQRSPVSVSDFLD